MSYKKLEVWVLSREIVIKIHQMTMQIPKFEFFEVGSQIRRSSKSTLSNIVEGYGRRKYKAELLRFIIIANASNDETKCHLEILKETGSLKDIKLFEELMKDLETLGRKLHNLTKSIEASR